MDFKYPYTDFHELNLDWFLAEFKKLTAEWLQVQHDWKDEQQAFQDLHDYVQDYFANLNLYKEVHDILYSPNMQQTIQLMLSNISASQLPTVVANQIASVVASQLAPVVAAQLPTVTASILPSLLPSAIGTQVTDWLSDHIDPGSGYAIDNTLSVQNAAADAKAVGDLCLHEYGTIISHNNHTSLGFNDLSDFPDNTIITIGVSVLETDITGLPEYGDTGTLVKMTGSANFHLFLYKTMSNSNNIYMASDHNGTVSAWRKLNSESNVLITNNSKWAVYGVTTIDDFPSNETIIVSNTAASGADAPADLSPTNSAHTTYYTKFSVNDQWEYMLACELITSGTPRMYFNFKNVTWYGWTWLNSNLKRDYTASQIYFTVPVNQANPDPGSDVDDIIPETTFQNVNCVLQLPVNYTPTGKPVPIIAHCHGTGQYVKQNECSGIDAFDYQVQQGYAVFDVNGYMSYADDDYTKGMTFGSIRTVEAFYKAFLWIKEHYNVEDKLFLACKSVGGTTAINFANRFPNMVKAIGLCYPVTQLKEQAWDHPFTGSVKKKLATEYFFNDPSGNTWEPSKVVGWDPISANGDSSIIRQQIPIKIWHGTADTVVDYQGSVDFINKVNAGGGYGVLRLMQGHDHSMGTGSNIYNVECTAWFDRFTKLT